MKISSSIYLAAGLTLGMASCPSLAPAQAASAPDAEAAKTAWAADMRALDTPREGCFTAAFPERAWHETRCKAAPHRPYLSLKARRTRAFTVGNGIDYALFTSSITQNAHGFFTKVYGLTSESEYEDGQDFGANIYSLQLNSGYMNTAACNTGISGCLSWQQFLYSSGEQSVFMQYWLIGYNDDGVTCPSNAWFSDGLGDCYTNSNAVTAPQISATDLLHLSVYGSAVLHGKDTVKVNNGTTYYAVTGPDTVVDLATAWTQSEYNVFGDGGGSEAVFNSGTHVQVELTVADGNTAAPSCQANSGTTGETSNLTLAQTCATLKGARPGIVFNESN